MRQVERKQVLEALVRAGKFEEVSKILQKLRVSKLSREESLIYANIAGRVGDLHLSLKLLNPIVRGDHRLKPASESERIQYANALRKLGAVPEAIGILSEIDIKKNPEACLNLAFCYSSQWQYEKAIALLRDYLKIPVEDPYKAVVGKVNLLAALIAENQLVEAKRLSDELLQEVDPQNSALLIGNVWELTAQLEIQFQSWDKALKCLTSASKCLQRAPKSPESIYIEKWKAIVESLKKGEATESLKEVRQRAFALNQWETYRDCEYYLSKLRKNKAGLTQLYFGTPFVSYRNRIRSALGPDWKIPETFIWRTDEAGHVERVFDLVKASCDNEDIDLPPGQVLHRALIVLSQDFYRPVPMVSLFAKLFPEEHFNPVSSPNRVHQMIKRLRSWISQSELPIAIEELGGAYRLQLRSEMAFRIPSEPLPLDTTKIEILRMKKLIQKNEFTAKDVCESLRLSQSEAQRLLQSAVKCGEIKCFGFTNKVRYQK